MLYNLISSTTSGAYLQTDTQAFTVTESTFSTQTPNLSCSYSGSTSISYSLSIYNGAILPSFVLIDSATGVLTIATPSVSSSTTYSFYITSTISGMSSPVQKIINLTVNKCTASNCQLCLATNSAVCSSCNSGYNLNFGSCILNVSEAETSGTAEPLSMSSQAALGAIALFLIGSSLNNLSSLASLWSVINQMQILSN